MRSLHHDHRHTSILSAACLAACFWLPLPTPPTLHSLPLLTPTTPHSIPLVTPYVLFCFLLFLLQCVLFRVSPPPLPLCFSSHSLSLSVSLCLSVSLSVCLSLSLFLILFILSSARSSNLTISFLL